MKRRILIASAFIATTVALAGCPRDQTPPREAEPASEPATHAPPPAIATPASTMVPQASAPQLPQSGHMRGPPPEPEPATPPPPVDK